MNKISNIKNKKKLLCVFELKNFRVLRLGASGRSGIRRSGDGEDDEDGGVGG